MLSFDLVVLFLQVPLVNLKKLQPQPRRMAHNVTSTPPPEDTMEGRLLNALRPLYTGERSALLEGRVQGLVEKLADQGFTLNNMRDLQITPLSTDDEGIVAFWKELTSDLKVAEVASIRKAMEAILKPHDQGLVVCQGTSRRVSGKLYLLV